MKPVPRDARLLSLAVLAAAAACTRNSTLDQPSLHAAGLDAAALAPQPSVLLADIYPGGTAASSNPAGLVAAGSTLYFRATTAVAGAELWKSDGTAAGTVAVQDLSPLGVNGSSPWCLTYFGGALYFAASDSASTSGFFRSDGTADGTVLIKRISLGSACIVASGGVMFFPASTAASGEELWRSDGTPEGTFLVQDLNPGAASSSPSDLASAGGVVYFAATTVSAGRELWKSDGTSAGTSMVTDLAPGPASSSPHSLRVFGSSVLFAATDGVSGVELWSSDGTTGGTKLLADVAPGATSASPWPLGVVGGKLLFTADDYASGMELWASDGTPAGTALLKDINPGANGSSLSPLAASGGLLYFRASDGVTGTELWKTDGTAEGTLLVKDIFPGVGGSSPTGGVDLGGTLVFAAAGTAGDTELWRSDGTAAGTFVVRDICAGTCSSSPSQLTVLGGSVYFSAADRVAGTELWKTDGTFAGTALVKNIEPGAFGSSPENLAALNGNIYFAAYNRSFGTELYRSDGATSSARLLTDLVSGAGSSSPTSLTAFNGRLLFFAVKADVGLWSTDGTAAGTVLVTTIQPSGTMMPSSLTALGSYALFAAGDGISSGTELWRTDGTAAGTYLLKDIYPGPMGSYPRAFVKLGGTSLFVASGDTGRSAMWSTDGTAAGTAMIADIRSCAGDAFSPTTFGTLLADVLYFAADDCSHGWELWRTDGTTAGTWLVKDINPGVASSNPGFLVAIGGRLVFQANDGFHGAELWTSGGTAPDTTLLVDIVPGASGGTPSGMVAMGDWALFRARGRQELWRTDGTAAETLPIGEIGAGLDVAFISGFVRLPAPSTEAVFVAFERATGTELWVSDGTAAGTRLAADVLPGPLSSTPSALTVAGEHLFFTAMTDLGKEPWAVPLSDLDVTPPVITATVTGTQLANGWYVSDVTVSFSVTDPESMVLTAMNCGTITITQDMDQTLTCTATSTGGTNSASVAIRRDTKPPGFNCLGPAPVEATSSAGAAVDFEVPAYDISPTSSSYSLPPGSVFPVGTTMVDVTATDAVGLATLCSFPVTVIDTTPPAVTCGPDVVAEATGPDGAAVIYPPATVTDLVDASSTVAYSSPSGTVFPLGTWPVSVEASDAAGNCASCAFQVTVRDTTPPVAFCPPDVVAEADYPTGSFVPIPIPGFPYDAVDQVPGLTFSPDLDGQFAVGVTHVTGTATDFSGNSASCVFDVLVRDTRPPSISCRSFDVEAAAYCGALVDATASASDFVTVQPRITYSPALPAYLGLGTTSITAVATDQAGNSASCSSDVTVRDTRPPRFERCPDLKVEATSAAGAAVTYPLGSAVDAADPSLIYSYDPPSGSTLPRGTTLVKVDATDHSGNSVSCSFQVVVADTTGPKLTCPGNITASAASAEGAVVEYAALVEDAVDPYPTVQYDRASGTVFPFGDTTVRVDASDATGNTSSCTFVVTVTDTHAPTLACPSDIIAEATSADGAIVSYAAATATDDIDAVATLAYSRASGERFALGASPVGVTATDLAGNAASCSFTITVRDTTAPTLACGGSVSVPATSSLGALVDYPLATASDLVDAAPAIVYSVASGTVFPLGVTTVSVTASDATGNISTCELTVSVSDTAAPALVCPAAVTAEAEDATGAVVTYAPASVEDVVDASPIVTYSRDSGARFSIGTTSVTATAVDLAGNVATCTFAVTVRDATPPALSCPADVTAEATSAVGAVVTYAQAIVTDAVDPSPAIACDRDPGSTFPLGISPVTVAATDASGNTSTCGFDVVVLDSTPPTVGCPDDVVAEATHASGAVVTFAPAAVEDLVDPGPMVSYSQATATVFPLGATGPRTEVRGLAKGIRTIAGRPQPRRTRRGARPWPSAAPRPWRACTRPRTPTLASTGTASRPRRRPLLRPRASSVT